jgi:hypothetical protein
MKSRRDPDVVWRERGIKSRLVFLVESGMQHVFPAWRPKRRGSGGRRLQSRYNGLTWTAMKLTEGSLHLSFLPIPITTCPAENLTLRGMI